MYNVHLSFLLLFCLRTPFCYFPSLSLPDAPSLYLSSVSQPTHGARRYAVRGDGDAEENRAARRSFAPPLPPIYCICLTFFLIIFTCVHPLAWFEISPRRRCENACTGTQLCERARLAQTSAPTECAQTHCVRFVCTAKNNKEKPTTPRNRGLLASQPNPDPATDATKSRPHDAPPPFPTLPSPFLSSRVSPSFHFASLDHSISICVG